MKKLLILFLAFTLVLLMGGCFANENRETNGGQLYLEIEGESFVCLDQILKDSDITVSRSEGTISMEEDGLTVALTEGSTLVYRNGYVTAVLTSAPSVVDGMVYVPEGFYSDYLCGGDGAQPSLFHGTLFFADEVLNALEQQDGFDFARKLLNELLLPASMDIETPSVDMDRVFMDTPLSEMSEAMTDELLALGYSDAAGFTYSEYLILSGAQTLEQAGMSSILESYPELSTADPNEMTVGEFTEWQKDHFKQQFLDDLSEEAKAFASGKKIELADLSQLNRIFYGAYMEQSDEALRTALEEYYEANLNALRDMVQS